MQVPGARSLALWGIPIAVLVVSATEVRVAAQEQRAILDLFVNQLPHGEAVIVLRDRDVLVRDSDLERAGLQGIAGKRETIDGEAYISLASLTPTIAYEVDEKALALRLTVPTNLLGSTTISLQGQRPSGLTYSQNTSAFFNYAINSRELKDFSAFGELGLGFKNNLLYSGFSRNTDGNFVRGLTNITLDDRKHLNRWVIGDTFATTDNLGGRSLMGGISFSRNFNLDPYFTRLPNFEVSGAVSTPATVDIINNGVRLRQEQLQPGEFEIKNIPVTAGSGATQLVIRDVFGREQVINYPFYFAADLLSPGLSEYSFNLGFPRENLGTDSWDYGSLTFMGRYRVGLTKSLTAGMRLEAASNLISGGPTVTASLPFGDLEVGLAASSQDGHGGFAGSLAYTYRNPKYSVSASVRALSSNYANSSLDTSEDRPQFETSLAAGVPLGSRANLIARYTTANYRDRGNRNRITLSSNIRLAKQMYFLVSASHSNKSDDKAVNEAYIGLNYFFGNNTNASIAYRERNGEGFATADIRKSLPVGNGFGYQLRTQTGDRFDSMDSRLEYQTNFGRYEITQNRRSDENSTSFNASGGVVIIGGKTYFTRTTDNSFALVQVPGLKGVRVYQENHEVGRTNADGNLLITNLLPYLGNNLAIQDEDIPLDYRVDATQKLVAPPNRGGAIVRFPVNRIQNFIGTLVVEARGKQLLPAYGELNVTVDGKEISSPIGGKGEFYLENISPGNYPATVQFQRGTCKFTLNIPVTKETFVNLEIVKCIIPPSSAVTP